MDDKDTIMQPKTERFEMRLDPGTIERVDDWRSRQDDLPSRAEAVRRLVEAGLGQGNTQELRLSDGEKLILTMLADLYKPLNVRGGIDPTFVEDVIDGGHYWGLQWRYPGVFHGHVDKETTLREVLDVLEMWEMIESGYESLSKEEQDRVEKEADLLGKYVKFRGFDGNNEAEHLGIAHFLIDDLDRFTRFKGRDLNSHIPSIDTYRRMLTVFRPLQSKLVGGEPNAEQIIALLKERIHPEHRKP